MVFSLLGLENIPISFSKDALQSLPREEGRKGVGTEPKFFMLAEF